METALAVPERNDKALTAVEQAKAIAIVTPEDYTQADAFCLGLKSLEKEVDSAYDEHISAAFQAHRSLVAKKKKYAEPIEEARKIVKGKMIVWSDEQERLRKEEEDRLREEAKRKADEAAQAEALRLEKQGNHEAAAAVVEEAAAAPPPPVKLDSFVPKAGTTIQTRWGATITDPTYVIRAIAEAGKVLSKLKTKEAMAAMELLRQAHTDAKYMVYDQVALNRQAVATHDALKLGGVVFAKKKV